MLFNLFLHYILRIFQVVEIIGGANRYVCPPPPQYFHWGGGGDCPPGSTPLCESSRKCHRAAQTTPTWTNFDMFYKIDCCAAIHDYHYAIMHGNHICYLFLSILRNLESNTGFLLLTHTLYSEVIYLAEKYSRLP